MLRALLNPKVIVVLWTVARSTTKDDIGKFITTADINLVPHPGRSF